MSTVKHCVAAFLCAAAASFALAQQDSNAGHESHHPQAQPAPPAAEFADGEVRRIDKTAGKITLRHGEIRSLDMPPMTMVFAVSDPAMLEQLKPGDKVRFRAADKGGTLTVIEMRAAP